MDIRAGADDLWRPGAGLGSSAGRSVGMGRGRLRRPERRGPAVAGLPHTADHLVPGVGAARPVRTAGDELGRVGNGPAPTRATHSAWPLPVLRLRPPRHPRPLPGDVLSVATR